MLKERLESLLKRKMVSHTAEPTGSETQVNGHIASRVTPQILVEDASIQNHHHSLSFRAPLTIAVDPIALVTTECIIVTSAMRKHARWAQSSVSAILGGSTYRQSLASPTINHNPGSPQPSSSKRTSSAGLSETPEDDTVVSRWGLRGRKGKSLQDNPLMAAFARLRADLRDCKGISSGRHL